MSSRIAQVFHRIQERGKGGLVTYTTAGDPDAETSVRILVELARNGADVLEVGVPFSDPVADGPVIQRASERALAGGMTLRGTLEVIRAVRRAVETPVVLFTYANPVVQMEAGRFAAAAAEAGVDGVLVLDIPVEEAAPLREAVVGAGLDPIFLISPTTTDERIRGAAELGAGFLYVISRLGVTGVRESLPEDGAALVARVRAHTSLPVALGFGISSPDQVAAACAYADAAVVGSALVNLIAEHGRTPDVAERAGSYVRWLKSTL